MPRRTKTKSTPSSAPEDALVRRAQDAVAHAYSPYSGIQVGAALQAKDGRIYDGCNVENASYSLTWCAERTALVKAVSEGIREFTAIAIATSLPHALMPCGACRQALLEFAPKLQVIVVGPDGKRRRARLDTLLPDAFGPRDLDRPA